jgi:hypothetical protein
VALIAKGSFRELECTELEERLPGALPLAREQAARSAFGPQ